MDLPYPKAYKALRDYQAYKGFSTKSIEEGRINKIRVTITGTSTDFLAEKVIPLTQGGMVATIKVPLGKNFLIKVQGMDDLDEVPGAVAKGVFTVESSETTPDIEINPLSTAVAEVIERMVTRDKSLVSKIDTEKLKALIVEGKSAANPYLVNFSTFADVIVTGKGEVPSIVPPNPVLKPGNLAGTVTGLKPGDAAVVFSNDPVSEPFIVVAPPLKAGETAAGRSLEFRIDNIPAGNWIVRMVASGYQVQGDTIASINELSATKKANITSNAQSNIAFAVRPVDWDESLTNASGNIGSSDQPDAVVDGSDSIHMAWRQDGFQENEEAGSIFYSHWNGKTWSTDNRFISPPGDKKYRGARNPAVTVGIDRTPHVVWSANSNNTDFRGRRVVYSHFDGVSWSAPLVLSTVSPQDEVTADNADVAINPINGQVYAVWSQIKTGVKTVYISQLQNGEWLEPIQLSESSTQSIRPLVNIGTDGWIRVTWQVEDSSRVQYIEWDGKEFSAIEEVPFNQSASGQRPRNLVGSLDRLNRLHLMLRVENTIQYLFRSNNSWSKAEFVHEVAGEALAVRSNVAMTVDNIGNVNAAWSSALVDGTPVLRYRRRTPAGWDQPEGFAGGATASPTSFPTPTPLPTATSPPLAVPVPGQSVFPGYDDLPSSENKVPAEEPQVVVDSRGRLSVIWSNSSTDPVNSEIYHSRRAVPGG
ncbi:MAG TPA: sialidase family protein [Candidatus Obscuribacterales bacterium]